MLDLWERWVQFQELYLASEPEYAPVIPLSSVVPLWLSRIRSGSSVKMIKGDTAAIRAIDARYDTKNKILVVLLQYADTNVTDPAFSDLKTGKLRVEPKLDGEGVAVSAHLVISVDAHDSMGQMYKLLLEEVPGLGRSTIAPFLRSEFKEVSKDSFDFNDPDDNNRLKKSLPVAEILGTPSKQLTDELEGGCSLLGIELVQYTHAKPSIDEEGYYTEQSRHVRLVPHKDGVESLIDAAKHALGYAKANGYSDVKLRYKHPKGKQKTATMGSQISDISDALVLKSEVIMSDEVLAQCSEKIVTSIADKMIALIKT